jgi:hypothetical protein
MGRVYLLTDRDFEEFYSQMCAVECKLKLEHGTDVRKESARVADDCMRNYRYHFIGWRNRVMHGDSDLSLSSQPLREPEWLKGQMEIVEKKLAQRNGEQK